MYISRRKVNLAKSWWVNLFSFVHHNPPSCILKMNWIVRGEDSQLQRNKSQAAMLVSLIINKIFFCLFSVHVRSGWNTLDCLQWDAGSWQHRESHWHNYSTSKLFLLSRTYFMHHTSKNGSPAPAFAAICVHTLSYSIVGAFSQPALNKLLLHKWWSHRICS